MGGGGVERERERERRSDRQTDRQKCKCLSRMKRSHAPLTVISPSGHFIGPLPCVRSHSAGGPVAQA